MPSLFSSFRSFAAAATVGAAMLSFQNAAHAVFTDIQAPPGEEATHEEIFENYFGGDFIAAGLSFTNGTVLAERVDDDFGQIFPAGDYDIQAIALFAFYNQIFGYMPGEFGGGFTELFALEGYGFDVTGSAQVSFDGDLRFARQGTAGVKSTQDSENPFGMDHVIVYRILTPNDITPSAEVIGPTQTATWVLFFEDIPLNGFGADFDYNDLVAIATVAVPEPSVLGMGLMLGAAALLRRSRRA